MKAALVQAGGLAAAEENETSSMRSFPSSASGNTRNGLFTVRVMVVFPDTSAFGAMVVSTA